MLDDQRVYPIKYPTKSPLMLMFHDYGQYFPVKSY